MASSRPRARRGSALILVLLMTLAIAGLSIAAIFLSSSASLLSASYDRERKFRLAALAAIEMARDSIQRFALIDTIPSASVTPMQLLSGASVRDAAGSAIEGVSVNVYAAMTGDTLGGILPVVTLVAQAYDGYGVRHVQRADLRPESFSNFAMFVNGNVSAHGPAVVGGRAHANGNWQILAATQQENVFLDTLSVTGTISDQGSGTKATTFVLGSRAGAPRIDYPRDSTYGWMQTAAAAAGLDVNLAVANSAIGSTLGGSRIEFVAFDADGDGVVEASEGFFAVLDFAAGNRDRRSATPTNVQGNANKVINDPLFNPLDRVIQHQCGAFYRRLWSGSTYRWHFVPVSSHARPGFKSLLEQTGTGRYPVATYATVSDFGNATKAAAATRAILEQPTARCFPAGSPYLMPAERFTDASNAGQHSGSGDQTPWGQASTPPANGWYGGSDTTFTAVLKSCSVVGAASGCATSTLVTFAALRAPSSGVGTALSHSVMNAYLWRLSSPYNSSTSNRGLVNIRVAARDTVHLSGTVRGRITVRVDSGVALPDRLRYAQDPNDPATAPCENQLGLIARGDILIASGLSNRVYELGTTNNSKYVIRGGGEGRFTLHGFLMSLRGSVGVAGDTLDFGPTGQQLSCPDDETAQKDDSNGGCVAITGGIIMDRYREFYRSLGTNGNKNILNDYAKTRNGMRYSGNWDRCSESGGRPPYFPVTTRVFLVRSLEVGVSRANTPSRVESYLRSLLGKPL